MEQRRLILLLVFLFSLFMLWDGWLRSQRGTTPPSEPSSPSSVSPSSESREVPEARSLSGSSERPNETTPASAAVLKVTTDLFAVEVSEIGGDIVFLTLQNHFERDDRSRPFLLFEDGRVKRIYRVQTGVVGEGMPNHKTRWQLPAESLTLAPHADRLEVVLTAPTADGRTVRKVLSFVRGSYVIGVRHEVEGGTPLTVYHHFLRDGSPAEDHSLFGVYTYTGPAIFTEATKYKKVPFEEIAKGAANYPQQANDGWLAMVQHYFVAAWLPPKGVAREFYLRPVRGNLFQTGVIVAGEGAVEVPLYAGPQDQRTLGAIAPGFELVVDYGWLTFLAAPLFWILSWFYALTGNWGWAIVLVTVAIKAVFYPLSAASYRSMARMRLIMPRLKALQEAYEHDKLRLQQEVMKLYQEERINPFGGCLPILVQIPVFIALYWVLLASVEMRHAPWIGWIADLSAKDPYFVLPLLMGATMVVQMRLNPQPTDPLQAKLMMAMPFVFTVMFLWFPAGLVLYWLTNNLLSILQQWWINRQLERIGLGPKAMKAANE
ncbi:MAG: membrane protein insertase YidC [Hydrogenophilus sp.]|nr:membrane protein insertase YidC [Hydrogenophilus sp.]